MEGVKCPVCGVGRWVVKYGKTPAGKQKYKCKAPGVLASSTFTSCGRQFVAGSDHFITPETKGVVLKLLAAGVHPTAIADSMRDISLRWIYELKRRGSGKMKDNV
jgi:transposase-like protein